MTRDHAWLLVLVLRNILNKITGQASPPGFRYASYEVIIPKRQTPRSGHKEAEDVNYLLKIEGKSHLVHLRQKRAFVPKHFPVFTYSKEGDLQVDYPFIRDDCFYRGFVQGRLHSLVAISTCSGGLRGVLWVENKTYEIEPVQASSTFQHVLYRLEEEEGAIRMRCGLTQEEQSRQMAMFQNTGNVAAKRSHDRPWWTHTMYTKLVIVVEHERYVQFGRNETVVALNMLHVIHFTNSLYAPLGIQVILVGLEIWSERNLIDISDSMSPLLGNFNIWRRNTLNTRLPHDAGHLFVYKRFKGIIGLAYTGTICQKEMASAVDSYTTSSLFYFIITFAHEQGHILGMNHDSEFCTCERQQCIMAAYHSYTDKFSNCSYKGYYNLMKSGKAQCMLLAGDPDKLYKLTFCGNKVVEHGEQCDCGSKLSCESDPCCQSDCRLRSGVTCAFGECCSKCQYLPAGTICRGSNSVCDLPEYCNGTSEWCPEDVYVQDGAPCQGGAYCLHGNCSTHNKQCKMIFGSKATVASEGCFRELNARGDRFGNCGINGSNYIKCNAEDILCGRVQCENINKLPSVEEHSTIIQTHINKSLCWSTDYHNGANTPDTGAVRDGTICNKDMMCINRKCSNVSFLKYDCNVTKCQNRGICNSRKNCHCDYGWAPPYCVNEGYGGSIDSGPPPGYNAIFIAGLPILLAALVFAAALAAYYRVKLTQLYRTFLAGSH
ncbi:disintegrin and metalloproteinase domain-containing protein 20-like [Eublepharis macularius]|uniref:Disintegrin and metalloproteinase domain-containing protein 20-like n=1 Tax=Eublepharis macularius TaxID=481883 RepID=A0AA97KMX1_EUBMA|nr:disintegrin and metalloproteinase domain-containing protein 20-like [Eublepharis macularius]